MSTDKTSTENGNEPSCLGAVMPRFFARGHFAMWILDIEYNGKEWTSMCTDDHIRDKDKIIKKAISDLKEEGLIITESDVKYWDCKWNVPLY
jgi:hypothetical protein